MPNFRRSGKIRVSLTPPPLTLQKDQIETEVKYFGLERDLALFDIEQPSKALGEVLKDIQDPAEASVEGPFIQQDLEVIDGVTRYNLKNEDFKILENSSLNVIDDAGASTALVNPRQRVSDRLKQLEIFAGRGKVYQGQGTTMYKYRVPTDQLDGPEPLGRLYSHTNPPPFFTYNLNNPITSDHPDYIPVTSEEISSSHRVGYLENGIFVPQKETEWWWSGEYNREERDRAQYGDISRDVENDPEFPIVKDGNISFRYVRPNGISAEENWGIRLDTWFKKSASRTTDDVKRGFGRFTVRVGGHVRIDYFDRTGYDSEGRILGTWKTALDTTDPSTYFIQESRESSVASSTYGYSRYYVQGGPSTPYGASTAQESDYITRGAQGGVMDLNQVFYDLEGTAIASFDNGYVPVVIRYWYGQQDTSLIDSNSTPREFLESAPESYPYLLLDYTENLNGWERWNDYSTRLRAKWDQTNGVWEVQTDLDAGDSDLARMNDAFEVYAYGVGASHPDLNLTTVGDFDPDNWIITNTYVSGVKQTLTTFTASLPGLSPDDEQDVWFVIRNRPVGSAIPNDPFMEELWQQYLFDPSVDNQGYSSVQDLLEGVGDNYKEPNPAKVTFDENPEYYKSKFGQLPRLNTYGPDRYDGMLRLEITDSNIDRDYDYTHAKSLFIGRQKKSELIKPLATDEVRIPGENYTFINVISDSNGNGGKVIINAFPENNLGILKAGSSGTFGKALNLADNTTTYSNPERQNLSTLQVKDLPNDSLFDETDLSTRRALRYVVSTTRPGEAYLYRVDGNNSVLNTSIIASAPLGTADDIKNHDVKTLFISSYRTSAASYNFYGLIGAVRESLEDIEISTPSPDANKIVSVDLFPDLIGVDSYNGTLVEYKSTAGGSIIASGRVTSFDSSTNTVTVTLDSGSLTTSTTYFVDIWFNFFKTTVFPSRVVNTSGAKATNSLANGTLIQINYVHNGSYQYSRADNGAGLSFSETLFITGDDSDPLTSESAPFGPGTETPAPPADIVTPFGYDNKPTSADKGLGGLCYPPYSTQNINLLPTKLSTSELESKPVGQFDVWWGSTQPGETTNLGGKYLEVTDKLIFDFDDSNRSSLISALSDSEKPNFPLASPVPYTHKVQVELNVEVPSGTVGNSNLYADVINYSNGKPVKDRYFLFINKNGANLETLIANPSAPW
jgi:hypothetical protein